MRALYRNRLAWSGLAAMGLLVLTAPLAGATGVPFSETPSYAAFGGHADLGHQSTFLSGNGTSKIGVPAAFSVATGVARLGLHSEAGSTGNAGLQLWSGVRNVSFRCGASCTPGKQLVTIGWNLTWSAHVNSTCPSMSTLSWIHASVVVNLSAIVVDRSTSPAKVVASDSMKVYAKTLITAGAASAHRTHVYLQTFKVPLAAGDKYQILAVVYATTYAAALTSSCGSGAFATVGSAAHPAVLEGIRVA